MFAPNLPGYGNARLYGTRDIRDTAEGVISTIVAGSGPMHLVGHSHGAAVALEIAIQRPDLVRSLTLIEPAIYHLLQSGSASDLALQVISPVCPTGWPPRLRLICQRPDAHLCRLLVRGRRSNRTTAPASILCATRTCHLGLRIVGQSWTAAAWAGEVPDLVMMALEGDVVRLRIRRWSQRPSSRTAGHRCGGGTWLGSTDHV